MIIVILSDVVLRMKKKILFVMTTLKTGGIATSLVTLLQELDRLHTFEIDLFLFNSQGDIIRTLPSSIHVISGNWLADLIGITQREAWNHSLFEGLTRLALGGTTKYLGDTVPYRIIFSANKLKNQYDVAVSCTQSAPHHNFYGGCNEFVLQNVKAAKKIAFIHCDYVRYGLNTAYSKKIYGRFDSIATVSDSCRNVILGAVPELEPKVSVVRNCNNYERIRKLSMEDSVIYPSAAAVHMVTLARLSKEKGHFRTLPVLQKLKKDGYSFCWHVLGTGMPEDEQKFAESVRKCGLQDVVMTYGNQVNPYRFLTHATVLFVPSFHEAAPMVFDEAKYLGVPILTTDTTSARELVADCGYGTVCENSEDGIYRCLKDFFSDPGLLQKKVKAKRDMDHFDNKEAVEQFLALLQN